MNFLQLTAPVDMESGRVDITNITQCKYIKLSQFKLDIFLLKNGKTTKKYLEMF